MAKVNQCENLLTTWTSLKIPFSLPLVSKLAQLLHLFDLLCHPASRMIQKQAADLWERYLNVDFDGVPPSSPLSLHSLNVDR